MIQQEFTEKLVTYLIEGDTENFKLFAVIEMSDFTRLYELTYRQVNAMDNAPEIYELY